MAEIVPNRVPCGKKVTPTPTPQPEPTPVTLCDLTGVKYFKLRSDIPGDYTKNCGLLGNEIDENFYFLRSMDILSAHTVVEDNRKYLILKRVNCGRDIKVDITDEDSYDHNFRVQDGYIYVRYPGGEEDPIRDGNGEIGDGNPVKFLMEGEHTRVVTDASINGDGLFKSPLSLDPAYRTGTYSPADFFADLTCPEETINQFENIGNGHAIVTKENVSRFGALYTFRQAKAINAALAKEGRGWKVPSKEDWAKLLNWAESKPSDCEDCGELPANFDHDTDKSGNFGCNAGSRLKATVLWENKEGNTDDFGFSIYPVGICPEDYNTAEPNQFGFTGLYKVASFWSSSEKDGEGYVRTFSYGHDDVAQYTESPVRRLSIRLVRDINDDFDVQESAEILGNYVPVVLTTDGTQQWTQLNIDFTNYEGYDPNEVTVPEAWKEIDTQIPTVFYYKLVESGDSYNYVKVDEYDMPTTATPVPFESVEAALEEDVLEPWISIEEIIILDVTSEAKFYYNAWDGNRWHKKMMREGESVVLINEDAETKCDTAATPYVTSANTNHEWRIYVNPQTGLDELVDTAEAIKDEMRDEFKKIWEHISGLTENLESLSGTVADIYDEMQSGFTSAFTAISDLQDELDVVEASVGLSGDGSFIVIRESGITASAETISDAIGLLDDTLVETIENLDILSGVVEDIAEKVDSLQEEVDNIEDGVGLSSAGTYEMKTDTHYLNSATSIEGEIAILDDVSFSAMTEIGELQKKTIEPLDDSIAVIVSGYSTLVGVNIDPEEEHLKIGDGSDGNVGLWFDGNFGLKDENGDEIPDEDAYNYD